MKSKPYFFTYLCALVIGVLLLVFTGQTDLFKWMVVAIAILVLLPSVWAIIDGVIPSKDETGNRTVSKPWYLVISGVAGVIVGVILLCMPSFFAAYIVYTLGVILILCGIAQIVYMSIAASMVGTKGWFYVMPWLTLICGIVVIFLGPRGIENIVTTLTGIFLVVYSINGFIQMGDTSKRRKKLIENQSIDNQGKP